MITDGSGKVIKNSTQHKTLSTFQVNWRENITLIGVSSVINKPDSKQLSLYYQLLYEALLTYILIGLSSVTNK